LPIPAVVGLDPAVVILYRRCVAAGGPSRLGLIPFITACSPASAAGYDEIAVIATRREAFTTGHRLYIPAFAADRPREVFGK
jgi:hypothetical protein